MKSTVSNIIKCFLHIEQRDRLNGGYLIIICSNGQNSYFENDVAATLHDVFTFFSLGKENLIDEQGTKGKTRRGILVIAERGN